MPDAAPNPAAADLLRWAEALAGIARTGMGFEVSLYQRERFEEVLKVAADIRAAAAGPQADRGSLAVSNLESWLASIGSGIDGYVTPKSAVGAFVGNERGELLLTKRSDSGEWYYPVGWADVGYSPAEMVVKEVAEETGIRAEPLRLVAVIDGLTALLSPTPLYSLVFACRAVGGELAAHPLETLGVGFFARDAMPSPLRLGGRWVELAFDAIDGRLRTCRFDPPRTPPWRGTA